MIENVRQVKREFEKMNDRAKKRDRTLDEVQRTMQNSL